MRRVAVAYLRAGLSAPEVWSVAVLECAAVAASSVLVGSAAETIGLLGPLAYNVNGVVTYGFGAALLAGGLVAAASEPVDSALHTSGVHWTSRRAAALSAGLAVGVLAYVVAVLSLLASGLADGFIRAGLLFGGSPISDWQKFLLTEGRYLLLCSLAGMLGAALSFAVRHKLMLTVLLGLSVVTFAPPSLALFGRTPEGLELLIGTPLGGLRAAALGNSGILVGGDTGRVPVEPFIGASLAVGWFALALGTDVWRTYGRSVKALRFARPMIFLVLPLTISVAIGATLPQALRDSVPWRWQPEWRHARQSGWASDQTARRWVEAVRAGDTAAIEILTVDPKPNVRTQRFAAVRRAGDVVIEPVRSLRSPFAVRVLLKQRSPLLSGEVTVGAAEFRMTFVYKDGRYLISRIDGPVPVDVRRA